LSFKIIFIQKSQIYVFRESLNLFEFENLSDLDSNLDFKFKFVGKKLQKVFYFSAQPTQLSAHASSRPNSFFFFFFLSRPTQAPGPLDLFSTRNTFSSSSPTSHSGAPPLDPADRCHCAPLCNSPRHTKLK
jgi:hypothetical protein